MNKSHLIVVDGLDGSGKSTQTQLVFDALKQNNEKVMLISYPDYDSNSSALVKMYLNGDFSKNAEDVNPYAASSFYAVDRYASFKQHWESYYNNGYTIIATRYTSSNAIHQMGKLPKNEWDSFLNWLDDYEYEKLAIPKPDAVIFLDMPRDIADKMLLSRYDGDESKKDIHEKNKVYMQKCQETAYYAAEKQDYIIIPCADYEKNIPLSQQEVTKQLLEKINAIIGLKLS